MAYNPFDFFRRNQKLFFGGLTVLVMFMFILSFGQGDFFSRFPKWIEKFQTSGDKMAVIDGSTIKGSQLRNVADERGLANGYMQQANARALESLAAKARKEANAATTKDLRDELGGDVQRVDYYLSPPGRMPAEAWPLFRAECAKLAGDLTRREDTPKPDDAKRVRAVRVYTEAVVAELNRRVSGERGDGGVYFANQPNRTERDRLEFLLWKKKADKLGIRYTEDAVVKLVDAEFPPDSIPAADLKALAGESATKAGRKPAELYEALGEEFRVRAAQTAVLGVNAVRNPAAPPTGTTRERYEHFVSETTATKYTLLTIPVEAYLPLVTGQPTEAELVKIFNEASNTDPDPASARGGVREPRKVGVQWVEVTGEEGYYKALAVARGAAFRQVQESAAAKAVFGGTVPPAAAAYGHDEYTAFQARVAAYRQTQQANPGRPALTYVAEMKADLMRSVGGGAVGEAYREQLTAQGGANTTAPSRSAQDGLTDTEFVRPELAAALAGLTASALATNAPLFAPVAAVTETAFRHTREQRLVAGIQAFQFPTLGGLNGLTEAVGGAVAMSAGSPAPLPPAAVQPVLNARTDEALRTEVATAEVQAFQKELARIGGVKFEAPKGLEKAALDRAEREHRAKLAEQAAKYAKEWIDARKLKTGATTEPRGVATLADDPGLAPLLQKDLFVTGFDGKPKSPRAAVAFGQAFVNETEVRVTAEFRNVGRMKPVAGLYQVRQYDPGQRQDEKQDFAPPSPEVKFDNPMFAQFFTDMFALRVGGGRPLTLVWRTAEVDPVRPLSLASDKAARDKCVAIWKLNKARELARQAADQAAQTVRKDGTGPVQLEKGVTQALDDLKRPIDPKGPHYSRFEAFSQDPQFTVAKMLLGTEEVPGSPPRLAQFNPTHRSMVYEASTLREELIAKKDSPLGTTFVVEDQPKTTLYLLVVAGHDPKGDHLFRDHVLYPAVRTSADTAVLSADTLAPRFATFAADADRKTAVSLLKAEFGYKDENPKLDDKAD